LKKSDNVIMETLQIEPTQKLNKLQLDLLRIYSFNPSESELIEIKKILAKFFADKLSMLANRAIEEKGISETEIDSWLYDENQ